MTVIEKVKTGQLTVKTLCGAGRTAYLQYYRQGVLMYKTDDGFEFPVPILDCGDASFESQHRAMELMRWIRKQVDVIKES